MQGAWAKTGQGLPMKDGAIAGMALEAIAGEAPRQTHDQGIAGLLGEHAGGGDRQATAIAMHESALPARPQPQGQDTVDNHQGRRLGEPLQGPEHGHLRGGPDADAVNVGGRGLTKRPG